MKGGTNRVQRYNHLASLPFINVTRTPSRRIARIDVPLSFMALLFSTAALYIEKGVGSSQRLRASGSWSHTGTN